ncbi:MAG: zinc-binding dehydrogenase, partial [Chloroflexota bacterium]
MTQQTRAAFIRAPFQIKFKEIPDPKIQHPDDVRIQVNSVGICGTDIHLAKGWADDWKRFGHETAATVVEVGDNVTDMEPGDLVTVHATTACATCEPCLNGVIQDCRNWIPSRQSHAFADFMVVPRRMLWKVTKLTATEATLIEPLSVALDLLYVSDIDLGQTVAVMGPGPIGLMAIKLCQMKGATRIIALGTDRDQDRLALARELGAEVTIDVTQGDPVEAVKAATDGQGVDRVLATAPVRVMNQALAMARWGGIVSFLGFEVKEEDAFVSVNMNEFHFRRLQLRASYAAPATRFPLAEQLLAERHIDPEKFITHQHPFAELEQTLRLVADQRDGVVKA